MTNRLEQALPIICEAFEAARSRFPCPEPLPEAVEAMLFGINGEGSPCPTSEQVRDITLEHAREMCVLQFEIAWLEKCVVTGHHPESGRLPRSRDRVLSNREKARLLLQKTKMDYLGGLIAYEDHFGREASLQLDRAVEEAVLRCTEHEKPSIQRELF